MSKIGIQHRIDILRDTLEQVDPRALAIHRMSDDLRRVYDRWRSQCERAEMFAERYHGPGGSYAVIANGTDDSPPMPETLRQHFGVPDALEFAADATMEEFADAWRAICEEAGQ